MDALDIRSRCAHVLNQVNLASFPRIPNDILEIVFLDTIPVPIDDLTPAILRGALPELSLKILAAKYAWNDQISHGCQEDRCTMSSTATLDQFLVEISDILKSNDSARLQDFLVIEPPFSPLYQSMIRELAGNYPKGSDAALEPRCASTVSTAYNAKGEDASFSALVNFLLQYFVFIRDVDVENLLDTYYMLDDLVQYVISPHALFQR